MWCKQLRTAPKHLTGTLQGAPFSPQNLVKMLTPNLLLPNWSQENNIIVFIGRWPRDLGDVLGWAIPSISTCSLGKLKWVNESRNIKIFPLWTTLVDFNGAPIHIYLSIYLRSSVLERGILSFEVQFTVPLHLVGWLSGSLSKLDIYTKMSSAIL